MIEIDGSYLEGGGQILRTSVALSALTGKPIRIYNIRSKRPQPGLKAQHLAAIKAVSELCNGELKGAELGSTEITFKPGKDFKDSLKIKIETAGSIGLVLQTIILALAKTEKTVKIEISGGATFGKWAPSVYYLQNIFLPVLEKFGLKANIEIKRHGFYPRGGALVIAEIYPSNLKSVQLDYKTNTIYGISLASENLRGAKVAERQKKAAEEVLKKLDLPIEIKTEYVSASSVGTAIEIWTGPTIMGTNALGELGKPAEKVGQEAAKELLDLINSKETVDEHLADQILPFMALAEGKSSFTAKELSLHAKTNIWVIEQFLDRKFEVNEKKECKEVVCKSTAITV